MSGPPSRLKLTRELTAPGRQIGDIALRWSDNANPLGHYPIPVISLNGAPGPTLLILGGVHGDEFEGPAAIMRLAELDPAQITGRLILIPALNAPAVAVSSRVSPLDGANMNRAFPGDPDGGPTAMLAHFAEHVLIPECDAVVDLHSGGKASVFAPSALATRTEDADLFARNMALARAMGLPTVWVLGAFNDNRSVNSAAARAGVPMIAAELSGGGGTDPEVIDRTEAGLLRVMVHLGMMDGAPPPLPDALTRIVEIMDAADNLYAPADGLFDRRATAGETIEAGDLAGWLRFPLEPSRPAVEIRAGVGGFVLAHTNRGMVARGEMLIQIARTTEI